MLAILLCAFLTDIRLGSEAIMIVIVQVSPAYCYECRCESNASYFSQKLYVNYNQICIHYGYTL